MRDYILKYGTFANLKESVVHRSSVVEHSTPNPKFQGSNPATVSVKEKNLKTKPQSRLLHNLSKK
jgi:hypothetical protein